MIRVDRVDWLEANTTIRHIRCLVFVEEQKVPLELDFDGRDPACQHVLAHDTRGQAVGTGRIQKDGKIGRMAVLADRRRQGFGAAMLDELIAVAADHGHNEVFLDALEIAVPFYERQGFVAEGEMFLDLGLPHRRLRRSVVES